MIKTATTIEGVNVINFGNTDDRYYWCKNIGETTLYVSAKEDISPDADDVAILESGDIVMIETYNQDIYVFGAGKIQIYETETNNCPFKVVKKGGEGSKQLGVYPLAEDGRPTGDVVVPEGVISLNPYVVRTGISNADKRITSVTFPETLKKLESQALQGLTSITSLDLKNVTEMASLALYSCANLIEVICTKLERLDARVFTSTKLKKIELPNTLTYIDTGTYYAFFGCTDLSELSVQEGFNCDLKIMQGNLSAEQMRSIIANYADNSGKTLTVGSTNLAKLTDDDKAVAAAKGLTLA